MKPRYLFTIEKRELETCFWTAAFVDPMERRIRSLDPTGDGPPYIVNSLASPIGFLLQLWPEIDWSGAGGNWHVTARPLRKKGPS